LKIYKITAEKNSYNIPHWIGPEEQDSFKAKLVYVTRVCRDEIEAESEERGCVLPEKGFIFSVLVFIDLYNHYGFTIFKKFNQRSHEAFMSRLGRDYLVSPYNTKSQEL